MELREPEVSFHHILSNDRDSLTDNDAAAAPDPELYPAPSEVARKSDIPVVGSAARLDAGTPSGAATLDKNGKLTGTQVPDSVTGVTPIPAATVPSNTNARAPYGPLAGEKSVP